MIKEKKENSVSIVIPHYNGRELLERNLPRVFQAAENPINCVIEVIVVCDGTTDDSVSFLKKNFPEVKVIKHKINRGFSAAVNTGARMSKGSYLVLLNNDLYPQINFLEEVLPFISKDPSIFGVSFHEKGWGWAKGEFERGYVVHLPGKEDTTPQHTFFVNAGGAIYRRDIWMSLGGMDEQLFSPFYWEDVDISYRALKRGHELYWHPGAFVSENLSASVGKIPKKKVSRIQERNQLIFNWKNLTSPNLFRKHLLGVLQRVVRHPGYMIIILMAVRRLKNILKARAKEKKEEKLSDEAILQSFN